MMKRNNGLQTVHRIPFLVTASLIAALFSFYSGLASATWLARGINLHGTASATKKIVEENTNIFSKMMDAFIVGDQQEASRLDKEVWENTQKNLITGAIPALEVGEKIADRLSSAKNRVRRFVGGASKKVSDGYAALAESGALSSIAGGLASAKNRVGAIVGEVSGKSTDFHTSLSWYQVEEEGIESRDWMAEYNKLSVEGNGNQNNAQHTFALALHKKVDSAEFKAQLENLDPEKIDLAVSAYSLALSKQLSSADYQSVIDSLDEMDARRILMLEKEQERKAAEAKRFREEKLEQARLEKQQERKRQQEQREYQEEQRRDVKVADVTVTVTDDDDSPIRQFPQFTNMPGFDCRAERPYTAAAIRSIQDRGTGGGARAYCAAANIQRVVVWVGLQCRNDNSLSALERNQLEAQITEARRAARANEVTYTQLTDGQICTCWTQYCAE